MKTRACCGQILNGTRELLPCRAELDHPTPVGGYARVLPALVQHSWIRRLGCLLCGSALVHLGRKRTRQHICARPFARVTNKRIAMHVADDRMRRDRNMDHFGPALRTYCGVVFWVQSRHRLSRLETCPKRQRLIPNDAFRKISHEV